MKREVHLIELLKANQDPRILFLKKYILLSRLGEMRINGQAPNAAFSLSEYLLDDHRTMIDWSRLSKVNKERFEQWFQVSEQSVFHPRFFSPYRISEINGKPEEVKLGLWGRFINAILFYRRHYAIHFKTDLMSDEYALKDIDIALSRQGALIDLVPRAQPFTKEKLRATSEYQDEGQQNVKRIILTDSIVESLLSQNVTKTHEEYEDFLKQPHPHAVLSHHPERRLYRMREYRRDNQYIYRPGLMLRLWRVCKHWFKGIINPIHQFRKRPRYEVFCKIDDKTIYLETAGTKPTGKEFNGEVYVTEERPPINIFVFSGGGAKIFGHLGAVDEVHKAGIRGDIFAGSSSGAIISMLLYLGYGAKNVKDEFSVIGQEVLLDVDISTSGISKTTALKEALGYLVSKKIGDIISRNESLFQSGDGQAFLHDYYYTDKITFRAIEMLKRICPHEPIGKSLFVTASDVTAQQKRVFSFETSPDMEIAEAVKISASMPVLYHPTIDEHGHVLTDGGCMYNTPVGLEFLLNHADSLIEHEAGANFSVLVFQFDNGVEKDVIHSNHPVYKENWILNAIYKFFTRVKNPRKWWERERRELRVHALQTLMINTDGVNAANFNIDKASRQSLIENGQVGGENYIYPRFTNYNINDPTFKGIHDRKRLKSLVSYDKTPELLYKHFENIEALMYQAAYRHQWKFLEQLIDIITDRREELDSEYLEHLLMIKEKLLVEKKLYDVKELSLSNMTQSAQFRRILKGENVSLAKHYQRKLSCLLFPLLAIRWSELCRKENEPLLNPIVKKLEEFRLSLQQRDRGVPHKPGKVLLDMAYYFDTLNGETHLLFYLLKTLIVNCKQKPIKDVEEDLKHLRDIMTDSLQGFKKERDPSVFMAEWCFNLQQAEGIIEILRSNSDTRFDELKKMIKAPAYQKLKETQTDYDASNDSSADEERRFVNLSN